MLSILPVDPVETRRRGDHRTLHRQSGEDLVLHSAAEPHGGDVDAGAPNKGADVGHGAGHPDAGPSLELADLRRRIAANGPQLDVRFHPVDAGQDLVAEPDHGVLIRRIVHHAGEDEPARVSRLRRRGEVVGVDSVRDDDHARCWRCTAEGLGVDVGDRDHAIGPAAGSRLEPRDAARFQQVAQPVAGSPCAGGGLACEGRETVADVHYDRQRRIGRNVLHHLQAVDVDQLGPATSGLFGDAAAEVTMLRGMGEAGREARRLQQPVELSVSPAGTRQQREPSDPVENTRRRRIAGKLPFELLRGGEMNEKQLMLSVQPAGELEKARRARHTRGDRRLRGQNQDSHRDLAPRWTIRRIVEPVDAQIRAASRRSVSGTSRVIHKPAPQSTMPMAGPAVALAGSGKDRVSA
jgi:hypothetical protein